MSKRGRKKWEPTAADVREIAEAMAAGNLTLKFAAVKLHMSMTTLLNRLDRIQEGTGIDLRSFRGVQDGLRYGQPVSRADRLRSKSDRELARMLLAGTDAFPFCRLLPDCYDLLKTEDEIPEEKCIACAMAWLEEVPE